MAVENDIVEILLKNSRIQRINLNEAHKIREILIPFKNPLLEDSCSIFMSPRANHVFVSMPSGDNYYHFHNWTSAACLSQLKGKIVTSIWWNKTGYEDFDDLNSGPILLGTNNGEIIEIELNGSDKSGKRTLKYSTLVYQAPVPEKISSLNVLSFPGRQNQMLVFITTPTRLYQIIGALRTGKDRGTSPKTLSIFLSFFSKFGSSPNYLEMGQDTGSGDFCLFSKYLEYSLDSSPNSFAWLTSNGVYFGGLSYGSQQAGDSVIESANLIPYSDNLHDVASHVLLTEFHILILIDNHIKAISRLNGEVVFDQIINSVEPATQILVDSTKKTFWIASPSSIIEILISDETINVWKIYLEKMKFESALKYCQTEFQKTIVYRAQADFYFETNRYLLSASCYAKSKAPVEEIALKFINKNDINSLKTFITTKLLPLTRKDSAQITLLATWVIEIYLVMLGSFDEKILVGTLKDGSLNNTALDATMELKLSTEEFHSFLDSYKSYLDPKTVLDLISSHGRNESKNFYAFLLKDYSYIIEEYMFRSEYNEALKVLEKYGEPADFHKHSSQLIKYVPRKLVDILIRQKDVDPRKLIPAFIEYEKIFTQSIVSGPNDAETKSTKHTNQAVRYLDFVIYQMGNRDKSVHHYYFNLFAKSKQPSEAGLQKYLEHFQKDTVCDFDYLLAECLEYHRITSATFIYSILGYYEDAVDLSLLSGDVELAIMQTAKLRNDSNEMNSSGSGLPDDITRDIMSSNESVNEREKRLWMKIATYVINTLQDYNLALSLTKRTNILEVKDLINLQPEFTNIDLVRESLVSSLQEQEQEIKSLYMDMNESMANAEVVSKEIMSLNSRFALVAENEMCMICCQPAVTKPIYVFPCQHIFHCDCLTRKVLIGSIRINVKKIKGLQSQLVSIGKQRREMKLANIGGLLTDNNKKRGQVLTHKTKQQEMDDLNKEKELISNEIKVRKELDGLVARECILCGESNVKSIAVPLIDIDKDYDSIMSWAL
ncbi:Vacuolar protein sorting-associated protein 18-like protein [Smittium mucronatum]|uniref:Vacuolar protein sorting-associated protein 18-like protein n=1 Tax=Smittium mucronatum TaxID=133383 RepID=A0A1R0H5B0_9FUNG|nr:Vacuolar protein sorting-associated protein 18-like protein [Smittium mucronatum]